MADKESADGISSLRQKTEDLDQTSRRDHGISALKAGLALASGIPCVGGVAAALQSLIDDYVPRSSAERMKEFAKELVEHLAKLEQRFDQEFVKSQEFQQLFVHACEKVRSDLQGEKLHYYRCLLVNSVAKKEVPPARKQLFLYLIDNLLPCHLEMLALLHNPKEFVARRGIQVRGGSMMTSPSGLMEEALPGMKEYEFETIIGDLDGRGLTKGMRSSLNTMMTGGGVEKLGGSLTPFANEFIAFVTREP